MSLQIFFLLDIIFRDTRMIQTITLSKHLFHAQTCLWSVNQVHFSQPLNSHGSSYNVLFSILLLHFWHFCWINDDIVLFIWGCICLRWFDYPLNIWNLLNTRRDVFISFVFNSISFCFVFFTSSCGNTFTHRHVACAFLQILAVCGWVDLMWAVFALYLCTLCFHVYISVEWKSHGFDLCDSDLIQTDLDSDTWCNSRITSIQTHCIFEEKKERQQNPQTGPYAARWLLINKKVERRGSAKLIPDLVNHMSKCLWINLQFVIRYDRKGIAWMHLTGKICVD